MVVWSVLVLAVAILANAAVPDPPTSGITTVGSLKLATAADCAGVVAFSATEGRVDHSWLRYDQTIVDKSVGFAAEKGIFTVHCPGLYQFSFGGYGSNDLRLTLKFKSQDVDRWQSIVSAGPGGGFNLILLNLKDVGIQVAVSVDSGNVTNGVTFSGYRIAKN